MLYGIYIFVLIFLAVLITYSKVKKVKNIDDIQIYKYPTFLNIIMVVGYLVLMVLVVYSFIYESKGTREIINDFKWDEIAGLVFLVIMPLIILYFIRTRFILHADRIIKKSPFGKKLIKYNDVKKIIIYQKAAMTRLYSDKRMTFDAFIEGYDSMLSEVTFRCNSAVVIKK